MSSKVLSAVVNKELPDVLDVQVQQATATKQGHVERLVQFPVEWLLDNDRKIRHETGQRVSSVFDCYPGLKNLPHLASASINEKEEIVYVTLNDDSVLELRFRDLLTYGARPPLTANPTSIFTHSPPKVDEHVGHFPFDRFVRPGSDAESCYSDALLALADNGLIIVDQCPNTTEAVVQLARRIDVELPTLYGTSWTVQTAPTEGPKNNVAYTAEYLDFHHDLVYYQAPPGLQLLHCLRFEDTVVGGESFFLDAFLVAEELRKQDPESFKALCEIPAAFMKDDMERAKPAQFYFATPHIHVNHEGVINEVRWAPPFEAPLPINDIHTARRYYKARASFEAILAEVRKVHTLHFRLQPGQCVVFQQSRVLHGRERFTEVKPHSRVLRGCYVGIDEFWNQVSVETKRRYGAVTTMPRGNRTFF